MDTKFPHLSRVKLISTVKDIRLGELHYDTLGVRIAEGLPFSHQSHRISTFQLGFGYIDTGEVIPIFGKASASNQTDIAVAYHNR